MGIRPPIPATPRHPEPRTKNQEPAPLSPAFGLAPLGDLGSHLARVEVGTVGAVAAHVRRKFAQRLHLTGGGYGLLQRALLLLAGQLHRPGGAVVQVPEGSAGDGPLQLLLDHYSVELELPGVDLLGLGAGLVVDDVERAVRLLVDSVHATEQENVRRDANLEVGLDHERRRLEIALPGEAPQLLAGALAQALDAGHAAVAGRKGVPALLEHLDKAPRGALLARRPGEELAQDVVHQRAGGVLGAQPGGNAIDVLIPVAQAAGIQHTLAEVRESEHVDNHFIQFPAPAGSLRGQTGLLLCYNRGDVIESSTDAGQANGSRP